jgi:hypothetical protein
MSEWTSRIQGHRVWDLMKTLGPVIDEAVKLDDLDPSTIDGLERLRTVLTFCGKRLGAADPLTMATGPLDAIAGSLESVKAEVEGFLKDRNTTHVANANTGADSTLVQLSQIPGIASRQELVGLIQAANSHREVLEQLARSSSDSRKKTETEIQELTSKLEAFTSQSQAAFASLHALLETERQKISAQASEQQKLFADAQEARGNNYNETLRKVQDNLSQTLTEHQRQFSDAQETRNRDFSAAQSEGQKRFSEMLTEYATRLAGREAEFRMQSELLATNAKDRLDEMRDKYSIEALGILERVKARHAEVEKLAGVIGNLGVTSGYLKTANSARKSMWVWQAVTVVALVAVICFAYFAFLPTMQGDFKWGGFATRVFLTITVGVLAAYAVSQADRFFHMEKQNRKLAMELAAIDPFIALLPQDEQFKFKLEIGRRTFGQEETATKVDKSPATAIDVITSKEGQQVLEIFSNLAQKAFTAKLPK